MNFWQPVLLSSNDQVPHQTSHFAIPPWLLDSSTHRVFRMPSQTRDDPDHTHSS